MSSEEAEGSVPIPEGNVEKVRKEWTVFEDGALALRLQDEEFHTHFDQNRCERKTMRLDVAEARAAQHSEEEEATRKLIAQHEEWLRIEEEDERLARQLQEQLNEAVPRAVRDAEDADMELARKLQEREKRKYYLHRERKKLARERKRLEEEIETQSNHSDAVAAGSDAVTAAAGHQPTPTLMQRLSLSDKYEEMRAFNSLVAPRLTTLTEQQRQRLLQQEDEHLARMLQQQDEEASRKMAPSERAAAIESKDAELARLMQEEEVLRARRRKEKSKQLKLLQQQQHEQDTHHSQTGNTAPAAATALRVDSRVEGLGDMGVASRVQDRGADDRGGRPGDSGSTGRRRVEDVDSGSLVVELPPRARGGAHHDHSGHPYTHGSHVGTGCESLLVTPTGPVPNIALQIDPTYSHHHHTHTHPPHHHHHTHTQQPRRAAAGLGLGLGLEHEDTSPLPLPPPQPPTAIQGQRRVAGGGSMEKRRSHPHVRH